MTTISLHRTIMCLLTVKTKYSAERVRAMCALRIRREKKTIHFVNIIMLWLHDGGPGYAERVWCDCMCCSHILLCVTQCEWNTCLSDDFRYERCAGLPNGRAYVQVHLDMYVYL